MTIDLILEILGENAKTLLLGSDLSDLYIDDKTKEMIERVRNRLLDMEAQRESM